MRGASETPEERRCVCVCARVLRLCCIVFHGGEDSENQICVSGRACVCVCGCNVRDSRHVTLGGANERRGETGWRDAQIPLLHLNFSRGADGERRAGEEGRGLAELSPPRLTLISFSLPARLRCGLGEHFML